MSEHNKAERRPTRSEYKAVWSALSDTHDRAKMHVIGTTEETALVGSGTETMKILQEMVGIKPDDTVLEIGCGVGRVGKHLAPLCRRWIGCDVSANMLAFAAGRLLGLSNVELKEVSGYNLQGIADESIDLVYCTVVFMHLESWDRYNYVLEAFRVLRSGGRIYIDNANLCSEGGWKVFETHRAFAPSGRPPHMTECSTPQEIETYLQRAGFQKIAIRTTDDWIRGAGVKPSKILVDSGSGEG